MHAFNIKVHSPYTTAITPAFVYKKKAARPAAIAPNETYCTAALDLKDDGDALGLEEVPEVVLEVDEELVPLITKLAQVRRVVLALWMTMERLPKKAAGPWAVET